MLTDTPHLAERLDSDLIGFLTAVDERGQPQTSPVWFIRDDEDLVVYNKPAARRLRSLASNERVAFNLRADIRAKSLVSLEGMARVEDVPAASDFPGYVAKYELEIERLGWTPESFSADYSVGIRITVTRVRAWGLEEISS